MTDPDQTPCPTCAHPATVHHPAGGCQAGTLDRPCDCALSGEGVLQQVAPEKPPRPTVHVERLALILTELPEQMALLPLLIDAPGGSGSGVRTVPGPRTPNMGLMQLLDQRTRQSDVDAAGLAELDLAAGEPRQGVLPELWLWCRMVEADRLDADPECPDWLPDEATVGTACGYLAGSLAWICTQPYADVFADDLVTMSRRVRAALRERDPYRPRHVGAGGCGWPFEPMDNGSWYRCTGCGAAVNHWAEMTRLMAVQQVTLREASALTGVPVKTLHRWRSEGILSPVLDGKGRDRLFDLDRVKDAANRLGRDTPGIRA